MTSTDGESDQATAFMNYMPNGFGNYPSAEIEIKIEHYDDGADDPTITDSKIAINLEFSDDDNYEFKFNEKVNGYKDYNRHIMIN